MNRRGFWKFAAAAPVAAVAPLLAAEPLPLTKIKGGVIRIEGESVTLDHCIVEGDLQLDARPGGQVGIYANHIKGRLNP